MFILGLYTSPTLHLNPSNSVVTAFKNDFHLRRSDSPTSWIDPAISKALDILIYTGYSNFNSKSRATEAQKRAWVKPFEDAIRFPGQPEPMATEFRSLSVDVTLTGGYKFVVARMGAVTRTAMFDLHGHRLNLPAKFNWNSPWDVSVQSLKNGVLLFDEYTIQAASMWLSRRWEFLKVSGNRVSMVGRFEGPSTLDAPETEIEGSRAAVYTLANPRTFISHGFVLGRRTVINTSRAHIQVAGTEFLQPELQAVDQAIDRAWKAKLKSSLQAKVVRLWPRQPDLENVEMAKWTLKKRGGSAFVTLNEDVEFEVKQSTHGMRIVGVKKLVSTPNK